MEKDADYLLQFDTNQFGMLEFNEIHKIFDLGYRVAMEKLPAMLKTNTNPSNPSN